MPLSLTSDERIARAKKAAAARWSKRFDWLTCDIDDGMAYLAELRKESEAGGLIMQRRVSDMKVETVECYNPTCMKGPVGGDLKPTRTIIDISSGRFAGCRSRHNPETGIQETAYACSAACFLYLTGNFTHRSASPRDISPPAAEPDTVLNEAAKNLIG